MWGGPVNQRPYPRSMECSESTACRKFVLVAVSTGLMYAWFLIFYLTILPKPMAAMNAETQALIDENARLKSDLEFAKHLQRKATGPSFIDRLQAITRGYLWWILAVAILGVLCAVLFFPSKAWARLMLNFVDCVVVHGKKFNYQICNQEPPQEGFRL